ncbi:MAG: hypothetical protein R2771_12685 [Saprospiraceae bacterium]
MDIVLGANEKFNVLKHITDEEKTDVISCQIEDVSDFHHSFSFGREQGHF